MAAVAGCLGACVVVVLYLPVARLVLETWAAAITAIAPSLLRGISLVVGIAVRTGRDAADAKRAADRGSGDEVLRLGVGDDDRRRALLRHEVELLGEADADALDVEQLGHLRLILEVGARRVAPRVARPAVLL